MLNFSVVWNISNKSSLYEDQHLKSGQQIYEVTLKAANAVILSKEFELSAAAPGRFPEMGTFITI